MGVKNCPNFRDVIYGRPLRLNPVLLIFDFFPERHGERGGDAHEGASRRLCHHLRPLLDVGRPPPRRSRSLLVFQVNHKNHKKFN